MSTRVDVFFDERVIEHENTATQAERPERLRSVVRHLRESGIASIRWNKPRFATPDEILRVHSNHHVKFMESLRGRAASIDWDTGVGPQSIDAAYLAAGTAISVTEAIINGEAQRGIALLRPPGHHAERDRAMGFCLFNNIAIAAAHARVALGLERVLIVDWDVHHGNGTQQIFYDRDDVLLFDSHRYPFFYPGTGGVEEVGQGAGRGYTVNVPLSAGMRDGAIVRMYEQLLVPIAAAFEPQLVLVSAGFDAHTLDPLADVDMTEAGYAALAKLLLDIAQRHAAGRVALILEGGYHIEALASSMLACARVLAGEAETTPVDATGDDATEEVIRQVRREHAPFWSVLA